MAKFFDPKEDVMSVEITQYGKYLLSKGEFSPKHYAFFDDDVVYDSDWAGISDEHQNDIDARIRHETPRLRPQYCFSGVETEILRTNELVRTKKATLGSDAIQPTPEKHYAMALPLGNTSFASSKLPAWDVYFLNGGMEEKVDYLSSSINPNINIPQLSADLTFIANPVEPNALVPPSPLEVKISNQSFGFASESDEMGIYAGVYEDEFVDGSKIKIFKDSIILELGEKNTAYLGHNFDIEVYEVLETSISTTGAEQIGSTTTSIEHLEPLYFTHKEQADLGALYNTDEVDDFEEIIPTDNPSYAGYYFEINVDREIEPDVICAMLPTEKSRRHALNREFACPDAPAGNTFSSMSDGVYDGTGVEPEDCD